MLLIEEEECSAYVVYGTLYDLLFIVNERYKDAENKRRKMHYIVLSQYTLETIIKISNQ